MLESARIIDLAEAVADGRIPDWSAAESGTADAVERGVIAKLRAVHSIHGLMTTWTARSGDAAGRVVLAPGDTWGGLEIRGHIGRGRFGDVYRAWDPALDRDVALKLIRHGDGADIPGSRVVFEGRLMARVRHPNVVTIHGAQRIDGVSGLWMELVGGRTLAAELAERGPFDAHELMRVGAQLARALDAVHRAGLVHRDVKAQNVLREASGRILLGDFGTGLELDEPHEDRGGLAGTPAYVAPEIFAGQPATPQSDLYSLGALLFYLATGQHVVPGRSLRELRDAHALGARRSLDTLRPDLPEALRQAIARALDPAAARRFESGAAMASAFEHSAAPTGAMTRATRMGAMAAVLALGVGAALYALGRPARLEVVAAPVAPTTTRLVLVAAFENRTGESTLDGTLGPTLARALSGASAFGVVPAARVEDTLALLRRPADTRLDVDVARDVARRDGDVVALVTGRVEPAGSAYVVSVEARTTGDDASLVNASSAPVRYGAIVDTVTRLAAELRRDLDRLGRLPEPVSAPLPRVTTASLPALELYAEALALRDGEGLYLEQEPRAEHLLRAAIQEDPAFVAAHVQLAIVVRLQGERQQASRLDEALVHAERALAVSSDVSRFEQIQAREQWHFIRFWMNPPEPETTVHARALIASCEELLQLRPDDPDVLVGCVNFSLLTGTANPEVAMRLAELRPNVAHWQVAAARSIMAARPDWVDRVRHYIARAARLDPVGDSQAADVASARLVPAREAWLSNRPRDALRIADELRRDMGTLGSQERAGFAGRLWQMYLDLGQLRAADEVIRDVSPWPNRRNSEVIVAVAREDPQALRTLLAHHFPRLEDGGGVASAFLEAGLLNESQRMIDAHRRTEAARPMNFSQYLLMLEGQLALVNGKATEAIEKFERFLANHGSREHTGRWRRVQRLLADALVADGELARAVAALESASTPPSVLTMGDQEWLLARERLAALYRRVGRMQEGAAVEAQLRAAMAVADDDFPIKRRLAATEVR